MTVYAKPGKPYPASKAGRGLLGASLKSIIGLATPQGQGGDGFALFNFQGDRYVQSTFVVHRIK